MNYSKHNFKAGDVIRAAHLNDMDAMLAKLANNTSSGGGGLNIKYTSEEVELILDTVKQMLMIPMPENEYNIYIEVPEWLNTYLFSTNSDTYINEIVGDDVDIMSYLPMNWTEYIDAPISSNDKINLYINNTIYKTYIGINAGPDPSLSLTIFVPEENYTTLLQLMMTAMNGGSSSDASMTEDILFEMIGKILIIGLVNGDEFMSTMTTLPYKCRQYYSSGLGSYFETLTDANDIRLFNWVETLYNDFNESFISNCFMITTSCRVSADGGYSLRTPSNCEFTGWPWKLTFDHTDFNNGVLYGKSAVQYTKNDDGTFTKAYLDDESEFITTNSFIDMKHRLEALENNNQ